VGDVWVGAVRASRAAVQQGRGPPLLPAEGFRCTEDLTVVLCVLCPAFLPCCSCIPAIIMVRRKEDREAATLLPTVALHTPRSERLPACRPACLPACRAWGLCQLGRCSMRHCVFVATC
jgi:hypothetical protein